MTKLYVAMEDQLLLLTRRGDDWRVDTRLANKSLQCLAVDPFKQSRVYCGTFGQGLWTSDDSGATWKQGAKDVLPTQITAIAVSSNEHSNGFGAVYVGTEPSMLYRSEDGGRAWKQPAELTKLPSSRSWSFPPRPGTHHVRHIATDPSLPGRIYLAIEAGALIRSFDAGKTWQDRVEGGPFDTHTLATHPKGPGRLYSSAGDGYFESQDYGATWQTPDKGLERHYLYSITVHPTDPDVIVVSASPGPWTAYNSEGAESYIYRKTRGEDWQQVHSGLPSPRGCTVSALTYDPMEPGEFYAANNRGIFQSVDGGISWQRLDIPWPEAYQSQHTWSVAVVDEH